MLIRFNRRPRYHATGLLSARMPPLRFFAHLMYEAALQQPLHSWRKARLHHRIETPNGRRMRGLRQRNNKLRASWMIVKHAYLSLML